MESMVRYRQSISYSSLILFIQVRNVMMGSKLPMSILGKIWDLSDQDKDGNLDRWDGAVHLADETDQIFL